MIKTLLFNAEGAGLILDQGAKIPHALRPKNQDLKQKQYCSKFNKTLKMVQMKNIFIKRDSENSRAEIYSPIYDSYMPLILKEST